MDALERAMRNRVRALEDTAEARAAMRRRVENARARVASDDADAVTTPNALDRAREDVEDADVVAAVLDAHARGDYFACLNVRRPTCDDAGRATWDVSDAELNRAFRRASLRVHPDKNRASDARKAFDAIGETQKLFRDGKKRAEIVREAADAAFKEKCRRDPEFARTAMRARESANADAYADEMRRQREEARRRAAEKRASGARRKREESDDARDALERMAKSLEAEELAKANEAKGDGSDGDDATVVVRRKPKKRFMF